MRYDEYKSVLNKLRARRVERKFEQVQVVKILGLKSSSKLSRWENGQALPSLINAFRLAGLYHVLVEDLFKDLFNKIRSEVAVKQAQAVELGRAGTNDPSSWPST